MMRKLLPALALLATAGLAHAQQSPLKITDIVPSFEKSPDYTIGIGPKRKAPSADWLWVEVSFVYNAQGRNVQPLDDLTLSYYILLNNANPQAPAGTLLTGTVTHTGVVPGTETHHSVALVSPQTLRRFFGGRSPSSVSQAVQAIGVTASVQGQLVGELSIGKGKNMPQWWQKFQQGPQGLVLNKDQTPFAPLYYDYFEAIKAKGGGF
jgi:hypothetical protein